MELVYEARLKEESHFDYGDAADIIKAFWSLFASRKLKQSAIVEISQAAAYPLFSKKEEWLMHQAPDYQSELRGFMIKPKQIVAQPKKVKGEKGSRQSIFGNVI